MGLFEASVVFVIAWWLFFLPSLSIGVRSQVDAGEVVPGSEPGAPESWNLRRKVAIAAIGALATTVLVWTVISFGLLDGLIPDQI